MRVFCLLSRAVLPAILWFSWSLTGSYALGDSVFYRYEGDVLPYDQSAGWLDGRCEDPCSESLESGHFVLRWPEAADLANYTYLVAEPPEEPPATLWVEWSFRSNHPIPPHSYTCDAHFVVKYGGMLELVNMYGDAAVSFSSNDAVFGLDINDFHTYRFESIDGVDYWIAVDGQIFIVDADDNPNGYHYLQFGGQGGCISDQIPNMVNEWDFVRFGTISYGEKIISSDPPGGFLDARRHAGLDRFTVTYDSPNYVYLDEITVEVIGATSSSFRPSVPPSLPVVTQTHRRENDEPDTVEIVLDRPIPVGETTRFTFNDGVAVNVVEYTFAPGDTDGDGDVDLFDIAAFQNCVGCTSLTGACLALDLNRDDTLDLTDLPAFERALAGP